MARQFTAEDEADSIRPSLRKIILPAYELSVRHLNYLPGLNPAQLADAHYALNSAILPLFSLVEDRPERSRTLAGELVHCLRGARKFYDSQSVAEPAAQKFSDVAYLVAASETLDKMISHIYSLAQIPISEKA